MFRAPSALAAIGASCLSADKVTIAADGTEPYVFSGTYATTAAIVAPQLPGGGANFKNPFGAASASYVDVSSWARPLATGSTVAGITAYGDSVASAYQIRGHGKTADMALCLTSGQ